MRQFDRQYIFSAGRAGQQGFETSELHIHFQIQKSDCETPNTSKINLWNLSPEHLAVLNEKDCIATLRAGYGNRMPLISVGAVSYIQTTLDGSDRMTAIETIDGRIELRDNFVSLSYGGRIHSRKILEDISEKMGITMIVSHAAELIILPNGFFFVGAAKDALGKICGANKFTWSIQNGILQITKKGNPISKEVFVLSPDSGLIRIPQKICYGSDGSFAEGQTGYEVQFFMNGAINVNDYVRLESETVKGYFRVHSVLADGDNFDGSWICTAKLLEV